MRYKEVFEELNKKVHINFKRFKPINILNRLNRMHERAIESNLKKNIEDAYVLSKRWLSAANWLQSLDEKWGPNSREISY